MDDSMEDTHICLSCQTTVVGLDNYVMHKKYQCPHRKNGQRVPLTSSPPAIQQTQGQGHLAFSLQSTYSQVNNPAEGSYNAAEYHASYRDGPSLTDTYVRSLSREETETTPGSGYQSTNFIQEQTNSNSQSANINNPQESTNNDLESQSYNSNYNNNQHPSTNLQHEPITSAATYEQAQVILEQQAQSNIYLPQTSTSTGFTGRHSSNNGNSFTPNQASLHDQNLSTSMVQPSYTESSTYSSVLTPGSLDVDVSVPDAMANFMSSLSPTTNRVVDPNMVLYSSNTKRLPGNEETASITDFLSSLELQYKVGGGNEADNKLDKDTQDTSFGSLKDDTDDLDHQKNLRIASILEDLDFSSDSEAFDADDLLNFDSEDEREETESQSQQGGKWNMGCPPTTGGKWKPGSKPASYQSMKRLRDIEELEEESPPKSGGKWSSTGGKWKPGQGKLDSAATRWLESEQDTAEKPVEENDQIENNEVFNEVTVETSEIVDHTGESLKKKVDCVACSKTFYSLYTYKRHLATSLHKRRLYGKKKNQATNLTYNCDLCKMKYQSMHSFAGHLMTAYHRKKELGSEDNDSFILDLKYQTLLLKLTLFQCHICRYFFNIQEYFLKHLKSPGHRRRCEGLLGQVSCTRCKFKCKSNIDLLKHMKTQEHAEVLMKSESPCVVRESRHNIPCPQCGRMMHSVKALKMHIIRYHNGVDTFVERRKEALRPVCDTCGCKFQSKYALIVHQRRKHTKERPFRCLMCSKSFTDKGTMMTHQKSNKHLKRIIEMGKAQTPQDGHQDAVKEKQTKKKKPVYKCEFCDFKATIYSELRPHFLAEHAQKSYKCCICNKEFYGKIAFETHCRRKGHKKKAKALLKSGEKTRFCKICNEPYEDEKKLQYHIAQHLSKPQVRQTTLDGIAPEHLDFVKGLSKLEDKKVECPQCQIIIAKERIRVHLRLHNQVLHCIFCKTTFRDSSVLNNHLKFHLGIKDHKCQTCGKCFIKVSALKNHMAVHGVVEKGFCCDVCGKVCSNRNKLTAHMRVHRKKDIVCKYPGCKQAYLCKSQLDIHMRRHTDSRPYLCPECGYRARTQQALTRHTRTHTGERNYKCDYCPYRSINSTNLRRHMRIHIGTKPFRCPYCSYTTNTIENLRKHILKTSRHSGLPVYKCKLCEFGTNAAVEFKSHVISVHRVNDEDIDVISEYSGIYNRSEDKRDVSSGLVVIQPKAKKGRPWMEIEDKDEQKRKAISRPDHSYNKNTSKKPLKKKNLKKKYLQNKMNDEKTGLSLQERHIGSAIEIVPLNTAGVQASHESDTGHGTNTLATMENALYPPNESVTDAYMVTK